MFSGSQSVILALLPEGTVKDEASFLLLIILLGAFVGAAAYLRLRRRKERTEESSG